MSMSSVNDRVADAVEDTLDTGYIIGTVTNNNDPLGLGRVQVSVPNLFDSNHGPVPWIGAHKKSPFGIGAGYGVYGSPAVGSQVRIKLQNGDAHYGLAEADEYSKANANAKFASPSTWGYKDPSGNELFVDMSAGSWQFTHSSGLILHYDSSGNLTQTVPGSETDTITGNSNKTISGNLSTNVTGTTTVTSPTINLSGNVSVGGGLSVSGTVTGASGTINISSNVNVTGTLAAGNGATGSFRSADNKTITVQQGIVTSII